MMKDAIYATIVDGGEQCVKNKGSSGNKLISLLFYHFI